MKYVSVSVLVLAGFLTALICLDKPLPPREFFDRQFNVSVPPTAKLIKDTRGIETLFVWQCTSEEIAAIENNPPKGYQTHLWRSPWNMDCFGLFSPPVNEWGNYLYLPDAQRMLTLDKKNFQLIGSLLGD